MDAMTLMANQFGDFSRFNGTTQNIKKKIFFVWRLLISHIIRHSKFVLQGTCTFLKKKSQRHVLFEFFHKLDNNGWKMHTGARARKQKYIYISIYISLYENLFENGCIYIYIIQCGVQIKLLLLLIIARLFRYSDRERVFKCGRKLKTQTSRCLKIFQKSYTN